MSISNVRIDGPIDDTQNLIAVENTHNLPAGLLVVPTVLNEKPGQRVVRIMNVTEHNIVLKRKHPVALLEKVEEIQEPTGPNVQVKSTSIVVNGHVSKEEDKPEKKEKTKSEKFDLPKSNGTANQQKRMAEVLKRREDAFMKHEDDLGFTN